MQTLPFMSMLPGVPEAQPRSANPGSTLDPRHPAKSKPHRLLACVLCSQRKVRCDHNYPCATCVKARVPCVQATQVARRQRRQFPKKEVLTRLRQYEDLLSQHNINYEPLSIASRPAQDKESPASTGKASNESDDEGQGRLSLAGEGQGASDGVPPGSKPSKRYESKRMFHVMRAEARDVDNEDSSDDEVQPVVFKRAWDAVIENDDHLLFGWPQAAVAMYTLHPQPVQVFQLWQLYLDNVNPLLKVTHTPSLQGQIIEAAGNVMAIRPDLEALMFSVYSMAITSLSEENCQSLFSSRKADLLLQYHLGCQQALLNSRFLRSTSRDCLTALYLYLLSIRPQATPEALSSILGIAIRIAQRMGIHNEAVLAKSSPLEAEMSRRLWWSLTLFDTRIGEMADFQTTSLLPMWDCHVPLNVNDSDLRHDMKDPPQVQGNSTDALFAVVRSELGDLARHSMFHLGYYSPFLKPALHDTNSLDSNADSEAERFGKILEAKYLGRCDSDNPLHYMTIWMTRGNIAKYCLMEHHSRYAGSPLHQAEAQREAALSYALRMLDCNTKLMTSPHTKSFLWMVNFHFPFVGYIQAVQYLKWRPDCAQGSLIWNSMNENYHANKDTFSGGTRFFELLATFVLQAWDAQQGFSGGMGNETVIPDLVISVQERLRVIEQETQQAQGIMSLDSSNYLMSTVLQGTIGEDTCTTEMEDEMMFSGLNLGNHMSSVQPQEDPLQYVDWSTISMDLWDTSLNRAANTGAER